MKDCLELAHMALRLGYMRVANALLRQALGKANTECPQARPMILRAINHARRVPNDCSH